MAKHGWNRLYGWQALDMIRKCWGLLEFDENEMAEHGSKGWEKATYGWKWLNMAVNDNENYDDADDDDDNDQDN